MAELQLRQRCWECEGQLGQLEAQLQALLPAPLLSITVNSHFLPRAPGAEDAGAPGPVAGPEGCEAAAEAAPDGRLLPLWCGHAARLARSLSLLLKGMDGPAQGKDGPVAQPTQGTCVDAPASRPQSEAQREIQECGVSVRTLRGTFEATPGLPCTPPCIPNPGPCAAGAQLGPCPRGCWPAAPQPRGGPAGGEPGPGDTREAGRGPDLASLRKERIVMLFLSHWRKSAYSPALRTAACRTREARRARPPPRSEAPRLGRLWQQQSVLAHLLGSWKAILARVPARQLRRLSRRPRGLLSPEQFLPHVDGAPVPYGRLTLDLFMLGYFQLLECDLPAPERRARHLLCFEVFERLGTHGWAAARAFHKAATDEVACGRRAWADGFEDIKARFFGSCGSPAGDAEPGHDSGPSPLGPPPQATAPSCHPEAEEAAAEHLGPGSPPGSFSSEDICGYIDRSFAFWKEKEAEMFSFGD